MQQPIVTPNAPSKNKKVITGLISASLLVCICVGVILIWRPSKTAATPTIDVGAIQTQVFATALASMGAPVQPVNTSAPVVVDTLVPPTLAGVQVHKIGDIVQVGSITVILNSATIQGNVLQANFTVENHGTEQETISSMMSFSAKGSDGTKLEQDIFNCTSSSLDGTVLPNDLLRGDICYTGVTTDTVKIYFTSGFFDAQIVVWEVSR